MKEKKFFKTMKYKYVFQRPLISSVSLPKGSCTIIFVAGWGNLGECQKKQKNISIPTVEGITNTDYLLGLAIIELPSRNQISGP